MSDHLDDLPASDHERAERIVRDILESSHTRHTISPSGELYRLIERYHNRQEAEQVQINQIFGQRTMSSEQDSERRRRSLRGTGDQSPFYVRPVQLLSQPTPPTPRERLSSRLARRGRSRGLYHPSRLNAGPEEPNAASSLVDLQNAGRQLEQASSTLRAHLDAPLPSINDPLFDQVHDLEEQVHLRRAKRRKLEADSLDAGFTGFRYGKYGQVDPGKLKMEIVSCDGGIYQQHGMNYAAENILRNDDTVYCTKSNRCNLVLRHQGATVFSLKELIIKAPHSGYTAPVQEGMIFVSMTSDDLLTRTAQYQIQYSPAPHNIRPIERPGDRPSIMSIRHNHDGSAQARVGRLYDIGIQDEECDFRTAQIPLAFTSRAPPFQVTTECSDSEEEYFTQLTTAQRILRDEMNFSESSDDEVHENYLMNDVRPRRTGRSMRRETASNITLEDAAEASQIATQEAVRAVGGEMLAPHARFFIERDKSKCTVTFDPPVSGRFILLKMWSPSPSPSENIDVQSVVAKGYAGPRFFPDITLR